MAVVPVFSWANHLTLCPQQQLPLFLEHFQKQAHLLWLEIAGTRWSTRLVSQFSEVQVHGPLPSDFWPSSTGLPQTPHRPGIRLQELQSMMERHKHGDRGKPIVQHCFKLLNLSPHPPQISPSLFPVLAADLRNLSSYTFECLWLTFLISESSWQWMNQSL